jgi:hypothetical protein
VFAADVEVEGEFGGVVLAAEGVGAVVALVEFRLGTTLHAFAPVFSFLRGEIGTAWSCWNCSLRA